MFFIIVFHMIINTGGNLLGYTTGWTKIILELICMIIIVHVNSFVLISGYFQYNKKNSLKKVISLVGMAWFYEFIISLIFFITKKHTFTFLEIIRILSPLEYSNNWFLVVYIALYLISPYLNIVIENLSKKEHERLIILLFIMFSVISTVTNQKTFSNTGFTLIHFMYIYIIGAYLKKHNFRKNSFLNKYSISKQRIILLLIFLFLGITNFLIYEGSKYLPKIIHLNTIEEICKIIKTNLFYYQNPILIIQSIAYFLLFETLEFQNRIINKIASLTFAVYIIHENPFINQNIYKKLGILTGNIFKSPTIIFKMIIYSLLLMSICLFIEYIRITLLRIIKNKIKYQKN